jgi:hypothetical protein
MHWQERFDPLTSTITASSTRSTRQTSLLELVAQTDAVRTFQQARTESRMYAVGTTDDRVGDVAVNEMGTVFSVNVRVHPWFAFGKQKWNR